MRFDYLIIGVLCFGLAITVGFFMVADLNNNYAGEGVAIDTTPYNNTYGVVNRMYDLSSEADSAIMTGDTDNSVGAWDTMTAGGYKVVRMMGGIKDLIFAAITDMAKNLNIECSNPTSKSQSCVFIDAAMIGFTVIIIFSIIYMVFRFIPR